MIEGPPATVIKALDNAIDAVSSPALRQARDVAGADYKDFVTIDVEQSLLLRLAKRCLERSEPKLDGEVKAATDQFRRLANEMGLRVFVRNENDESFFHKVFVACADESAGTADALALLCAKLLEEDGPDSTLWERFWARDRSNGRSAMALALTSLSQEGVDALTSEKVWRDDWRAVAGDYLGANHVPSAPAPTDPDSLPTMAP